MRLPVESANIRPIITVPDDRWVLWARRAAARPGGALLGASSSARCSPPSALGRLARSPLRTVEWMLLVIGLTQVPLPAALVVVGWLFFLAWRGSESLPAPRRRSTTTCCKSSSSALTATALGILLHRGRRRAARQPGDVHHRQRLHAAPRCAGSRRAATICCRVPAASRSRSGGIASPCSRGRSGSPPRSSAGCALAGRISARADFSGGHPKTSPPHRRSPRRVDTILQSGGRKGRRTTTVLSPRLPMVTPSATPLVKHRRCSIVQPRVARRALPWVRNHNASEP